MALRPSNLFDTRPSPESINELLAATEAAHFYENTSNQLSPGTGNPTRNLQPSMHHVPAPRTIYHSRNSKPTHADGYTNQEQALTSLSSGRGRGDRQSFSHNTLDNAAPPRPSRTSADTLPDHGDIDIDLPHPFVPADGVTALDLATPNSWNVLTRSLSNTSGTQRTKTGAIRSFLSA
jgi:hypothetical protein